MKIPPEKFESVLFINQILKFDFNSSVKVLNSSRFFLLFDHRYCFVLQHRFRVIFIHFIPCFSLIVLKIKIIGVTEAERKRDKLKKKYRKIKPQKRGKFLLRPKRLDLNVLLPCQPSSSPSSWSLRSLRWWWPIAIGPKVRKLNNTLSNSWN